MAEAFKTLLKWNPQDDLSFISKEAGGKMKSLIDSDWWLVS